MTGVEQQTKDQMAREDWLDGPLDTNCVIEIRRCFNGVIVRPSPGFDRSNCVNASEVLVFQSQDQFWDWYQHWYDRTNQGAKS
jgi:hypothetical protein